MTRQDPGHTTGTPPPAAPPPCACSHSMVVHHIDAHGARRSCSTHLAGLICGCLRYEPADQEAPCRCGHGFAAHSLDGKPGRGQCSVRSPWPDARRAVAGRLCACHQYQAKEA